MASLARLTSLSTQTLSLLLERQRLQTLPLNSTSLHAPQIIKNLDQLRIGILELEEKEGPSEAARLLRTQHERMRGMLGAEADSLGVQRCVFVRVSRVYHEPTCASHPLPCVQMPRTRTRTLHEQCSLLVILPLPLSDSRHGPAADVIRGQDRKSTRLNSSHSGESRMPSSA